MEDVIYVNESYMDEYVSDDMFNDESYIGDLDMYEEMYIAETQSFIEKMADFIKRLFTPLQAFIERLTNKHKIDKIHKMMNDPSMSERLSKEQTKRWDHDTFMEMLRGCQQMIELTYDVYYHNILERDLNGISPKISKSGVMYREIEHKSKDISKSNGTWSKYDAYNAILEEYELLSELNKTKIKKLLHYTDTIAIKTFIDSNFCPEGPFSITRFKDMVYNTQKAISIVTRAQHIKDEMRMFNSSEYKKHLA